MASTNEDLSSHKVKPIRYLLLGTAGHIDHGKTALIKALTGIDTDRLPEEQRRGMTIELGFAHMDLGDVRFGVVDVPGHEKFVRTMVAGASGIDLVMLVVAADDSVMPQTSEHVDILRLLGVHHGVVAVSKCDLVDQEMADLVAEDVNLLLEGTPMASFPVIQVSSHTNQGMDDLKDALLQQADAVAEKKASKVFRLAIDRVFTIHGRGTVVTGSAISGQVSVGEPLESLPSRRTCRVRGLQSHFDQVKTLHWGQRVAVNLTGVDKEHIKRGDELASPGYLTPAQTLDAHVIALNSNTKPIKHLQRVRLCIGTGEHLVKLRLLGADRLKAGENGFAQLLSSESVVAEWGQRYIIRDETDSRTLGGGTILRPVSRRLRNSDTADIKGLQVLLDGSEADRLEEVIRFEPGVVDSELRLACCSGVAIEHLAEQIKQLEHEGRLVGIGEHHRLVSSSMIADRCNKAIDYLQKYHAKQPDDPGCPVDSFIGLLKRKYGEDVGCQVYDQIEKQQVKIVGRFCCLREFAPQLSQEDERLLREILAEYLQAGYQPPRPAELRCAGRVRGNRTAKLIKIAGATGELIQITPEIILHHQCLDDLKRRLADRVAATGGFTVAEVRNMINSSRKFVVPILEYLDKVGFTQRTGDQRVLAEASSK